MDVPERGAAKTSFPVGSVTANHRKLRKYKKCGR